METKLTEQNMVELTMGLFSPYVMTHQITHIQEQYIDFWSKNDIVIQPSVNKIQCHYLVN